MAWCAVCKENLEADEGGHCPECGGLIGGADAPGAALSWELPFAPPPSSGPASVSLAQLSVLRGGVMTGSGFPIGSRVTLGRGSPETGPVDVDLSELPEGCTISRPHALIFRDALGQWCIQDLGSKNGTYIRAAGQDSARRVEGRYTVQAIEAGDEIILGSAHFLFQVE
jgi:hypothetical protein